MPLAYILMSSKTFELYDEIFIQLKRNTKKLFWFSRFSRVKSNDRF